MRSNQITQVHNTTQDELTSTIIKAVENKLDSLKEHFINKPTTTWITRKEVAIILSVSLVTVDNWTNKGILTAYRIGTKKRYKREEIENSLVEIKKR